jgi:hypothetical protein
MKLSLKVKKLQLSCAGLGSFACFGCTVGFERQANVLMQWRLKCEGLATTLSNAILFFKVQVVTRQLPCPHGKSLLVECHPLVDFIVPATLPPIITLFVLPLPIVRSLLHKQS